MERLRRYLSRPPELGGDEEEPPPVPGLPVYGQPEHEVAAILKFAVRAGRPQVLIRWAGLDASGDTWEPYCEEAIRDFERARGVVLPRVPPPPGVRRPRPPPGYSVDAAPGDLGAALVGRRILYWWPAARHRRADLPAWGILHVVAYHRRTSALRGTVESLLDAASYGARWVLLSPLLALSTP